MTASVRLLSEAEVESRLTTYHPPDRDAVLEREVLNGTDVLLLGPSASGKTVSALATARACHSRGRRVLWIDLVDPRPVDPALTGRLLGSGPSLVVVDNIQAGVGAAEEVGALLGELRERPGVELTVLAIGWPSARTRAATIFPAARQVAARGDEVIGELVRRLPATPDEIARVAELADGDVVVAGIVIDHLTAHGVLPAEDEITGIVAERTGASRISSDEGRRLLYWFACLGVYEIDVAADHCARLPRHAFDELVRRSLVRLDGNAYRIGHRSLAALLVRHARRSWDADFEAPPQVAVRHLRGVGDRQIRATLDKLDLMGSADAFLGRAWQSLVVLTHSLVRQVEADPTWADNVASAVFSCEALAQLGEEEAWLSSAHYIRSRWACRGDGSLPAYLGAPPADSDDFQEIRRSMAAEDDARPEPHRSGQPAAGIDFDRMHRTWVLGLLLGFEASAPHRDGTALRALLRTAARSQEPSGAFYPERVPWVTARVVLGLCRAGESYATSPVVKRACDWLRTSRPDGPHAQGAWESGTGAWNSTLMTTAMCLAALGSAGVPWHDRSVRAGLAHLRGRRGEWRTGNGEMDLANVLTAMVLIGGRWQDLAGELGALLTWARHPAAWAGVTRKASEAEDESSKVPFVAAQLVAIVWATVKRELPALLGGAEPVHRPAAPAPTGAARAQTETPGHPSGRSDRASERSHSATVKGNSVTGPTAPSVNTRWT